MLEGKNVYSVRQVNNYIKRMFEEDFVLKGLYVKGEVSNCKYHYSGHVYFSLKDESGVLSAVMFSSNVRTLAFKLEDGMQVVVYGNVSVYERDGRYQLYARSIEKAGQGDLYKQFEQLKARLAESGMFDNLYKRPIPRYSMKIGVVTAQTGAVIRDIYNVASRHNPYCRIYLYPAKVQGDGAAQSICNGIQTLDRMGLDAIIIGRGGGSMEDLWAFNDEVLAQVIFQARTPIISAVGHETDFTIADFVADLRAPTPSAAAELAVFDYNQFLLDLDSYLNGLAHEIERKISQCKSLADHYALRLELLSPAGKLEQHKQKAQLAAVRLNELMQGKLNRSRQKLITLSERMDGLSPMKRLQQGYSFLTDGRGKNVRSITQVQAGETIHVQVSDGEFDAQICEILP